MAKVMSQPSSLRFGPQRAALLAAAFLLSILGCRTTPPAPTIPEVAAPPIDYSELLRLCMTYASIRYGTPEQARAEWAGYYSRLEVVEIAATRNRYLIGWSREERLQEVVIRGTTNLRNALYDVRFRRHWNPELGLYLHAGFEAMALALHRDLLPRLDREGELVIFGHSLGAAEAVILAMLLEREGYRLRRVYATGQPKVTDQDGASKYRDLPLVRVVNENDPVPLLPPSSLDEPGRSYRHLGGEYVLLDGPYFAYLAGEYANDGAALAFWNNLRQQKLSEELHEHRILSYLARLRPKLQRAVQVPFQERERYISGSRAFEQP
jgi:triacylglycerol lipase